MRPSPASSTPADDLPYGVDPRRPRWPLLLAGGLLLGWIGVLVWLAVTSPERV